MRELGIEVPDPASVRLPLWLRLQARIAPVDRLLAAREAAEDDEVDDLYKRSTGDPVTDRLLREIRKEERSHSTRGPGDPLRRRAPTAAATAAAGSVARLPRRRSRSRAPGRASTGSSDARSGTARAAAGSPARSTAPTTGSPPCSGSSPASRARPAGRAPCSPPGSPARSPRRCRWRPARSSPSAPRPRSPPPTSSASARRSPSTPRRRRRSCRSSTSSRGSTRRPPTSSPSGCPSTPTRCSRRFRSRSSAPRPGGGSNAAEAALAAGVSTGLGAIVPVIPFMITTGTAAIVAAAIVSLIAHFLVGAAKSLVTLRSWWSAGLEMTLAGVIVGGATYLVGLALPDLARQRATSAREARAASARERARPRPRAR